MEWPNLLPERLDDELNAAEGLGIRPTTPGTAVFDEIIGTGTGRMKWVVTVEKALLVIPFEKGGRELAHTVASGGRPVLAAGEADVAGEHGRYIGLDITNHSGHYQPDSACLDVAREAFRVFGIEFPF